MQIVRYTPDKAHEWDNFIEGSRNGTFLFLRAYMDYHSRYMGHDSRFTINGKFEDHSLMYYTDKGKLLAVMAANERSRDDGLGIKELWSHQGLTYGGFILAPKAHAAEVGEMFDITLKYLKENGFSEWYYKQMPTIYHKMPSEEDEYWLWRHGAEIVDCSLMTAIPLTDGLCNISSSKKNNSNKLFRLGYKIDTEAHISDFWPILTENLQKRFNAKPVHTYEEITLLQSRFPERIKCCTVSSPGGEVLGGTILYLTDNVIKAQYTSASPQGKAQKALDFLILTILQISCKKSRYTHFDFGTSTLANSTSLNTGLVLQKEGFGGRGIACKTYRING